ncbi:MAG: FG-GAP-like repeat-containing protein, partial [Planctomycetota bacterium]
MPVALDADTESRVVAFCSDCHAMPLAESFPRDAWHDEVRQGYFFYGRSARNDLDPPPMYLTVAYFRSRAPEQFVFPEPEEAETELRAAFEVEQLYLGRNDHIAPGVSYLRWTSLGPDEATVLLACDMRLGYVAAVDLRGQRLPPRILARLANSCHVEPCDLDGNGAVDLVVADLGSFFPADHDHGRVVWLQRQEAASSFAEVVVASGLGRVADARPADLDADGDLDLIVAEFGHYRTGKIVLLRNVGLAGDIDLDGDLDI